MVTQQIQNIFFEKIKEKLPPHLSLVNAVSDVLELSSDSTYRRLRGEKQLSLEEVQKLSLMYKVSIDELFQLENDSFLFNGRIANKTDFKYGNWLEECVVHLQRIHSYTPNHMYYLAKEIPFFYYFLIPEITAFKSYFFMKSILEYKNWRNAKFSLKDDYSRYIRSGNEISRLFSLIPSTEIWNIENITSTLHQIEFYHATQQLASLDDAMILYDKLNELISHIEKQTECGFKLPLGVSTLDSGPEHRMYINELTMGDNMQFMEFGTIRVTYINHSILNFITTFNKSFNDYTKQTIEGIAHKSTPISIANQKDRIVFFNKLRAKIESSRNSVLSN